MDSQLDQQYFDLNRCLANAAAGDAIHDFGCFQSLLKYIYTSKEEFSQGFPQYLGRSE